MAGRIVSTARYSMLALMGAAAIVLANLYSLLITNHGLLISNVFPDLHFFDRLIPESYATFMFASVLQFGILVLYFVVATVRPGHKSYVLPFLIIMVTVSFYFGFLSVHSNARGDAYVSGLNQRIDGVAAEISGEMQHISTDVDRTLASYQLLAKDAQKGNDKSGLSGCGPICRGYYDDIERVRSRFSHLIALPPVALADGNAKERWGGLNKAYNSYLNRNADYQRFLASEQRASRAPNPVIGKEMQRLEVIFERGRTDALSLTSDSLERVDRDRDVMISSIISLLPDLINLSMAFSLIALRRSAQPKRRRAPLFRRRKPDMLRAQRKEPVLQQFPLLAAPERQPT